MNAYEGEDISDEEEPVKKKYKQSSRLKDDGERMNGAEEIDDIDSIDGVEGEEDDSYPKVRYVST